MRLKKKNLPIIVFWIMILSYSFFSSMMPISFGIAEFMVGMLLVFLAANRGTAELITHVKVDERDKVPPPLVRLSFILLLVVPCIAGIITQNDIQDIIRDVLPLMFFFVPILFYSRLLKSPSMWLLNLSYALAFTGIVMSLRHFLGAENSIEDLGTKLILGDKVSLAHDPAVLFAAIFLAGTGINKFFKGHLLTASIFLFLSGIPIAAIFAVAARAPFGLLVIALLSIIYFSATSNFVIKLIAPMVIMILGAIVFYVAGDTISHSVDLMLLKQENYGLSHRDIELMAVIDNITGSFVLFFGEGWGGLISNPIGGGSMWSFVHNIGAYFLFKTGVIGVIMCLIYLYWIAKSCLLSVRKSKDDILIILIAAVPPILVNGLLEVGFKTITFGLLLTIIITIYLTHQQVNLIDDREVLH